MYLASELSILTVDKTSPHWNLIVMFIIKNNSYKKKLNNTKSSYTNLNTFKSNSNKQIHLLHN